MLYPFATLGWDNTEIVFSEIKISQDNTPVINVLLERWSDKHDAFDEMEMLLPEGKMLRIIGYSPAEADELKRRILALSDTIFSLAKEYADEGVEAYA